jgi:hypothetical protein
VAKGEFGRTVGPLTSQLGAPLLAFRFFLVSGGVRGGAIGSTTPDGRFIDHPGRTIAKFRRKDIAATILQPGINYTHRPPYDRWTRIRIRTVDESMEGFADPRIV